MTAVRALAFGDADAGSWGAAWTSGADATVSLAAAVDANVGILTGELIVPGEGEAWRIEGNGISVLFTPIGAAGQGDTADDAFSSSDQLCAVTGAISLDGTDRELNSMGWRATIQGEVELDRIDSFRHVSGWFEPTRGFSLVALRPRKSRGQDADLVAAVLLEPERTPPVAEPRLSTTYDAAGLPARAGLELWLEEQSGDQDEANHHYPRRAAAEAVGTGVDWEVAGFKLHAALLRWHSRATDGTGVYLLGRRE